MQESNTLVASLFQHRLRLSLLRKTADQFHQRFHTLTGYVRVSFHQNCGICFCNIEEISESKPSTRTLYPKTVRFHEPQQRE